MENWLVDFTSLGSIRFMLFFLAVAAIYYMLPSAKWQNALLLVASAVFYLSKIPIFGVVVLLATVFSYFVARALGAATKKRKKQIVLALGVVISVAALAAFKYLPGITMALQEWGLAPKPDPNTGVFSIIMPLGLSYFTFQIISYLVDVYRGSCAVEKRFFRYALYIAFFPNIVSGPINRAGEMLPQFEPRRDWSYSKTVEGLQRFLTGAFKKIVIGDTLFIFVKEVFFTNLENYTGLMLLFTLLAYTFYLYANFSGYCDMAIGVAKILGIEMRENFAAPLLSQSQSEFWGRWHMSLMSWFRDYVYFPLGGNRKGFLRKLFNITVVCMLSGIWHTNALSWNFVMWGAWLALFRIVEELVTRARGLKKTEYKTKLGRALATVWTFFVITAGWLFFTLDWNGVVYFAKNMFRFAPLSATIKQFLHIASGGIANTGTFYALMFAGLLVGLFFLLVFDIKINKSYRLNRLQLNPLGEFARVRRWLSYWAMGLITAYFYLMYTASGAIGAFAYGGY